MNLVTESLEYPELQNNEVEEVPLSLEALEYVGNITELYPEVWQGLELDERIGAMKELESRLSLVELRPVVPLSFENLGEGVCGYFDGQMIHVNMNILSDSSPLEAIDTVAHEGRHAYQHYAVSNPEIHDDPKEVALWAENFKSYISAEMYGYELYRNQPVEADAWEYGETIRKIFDTK